MNETTKSDVEVNWNSMIIDGVDKADYPDFSDAYFYYGEYTDGTLIPDSVLDELTDLHSDILFEMIIERFF